MATQARLEIISANGQIRFYDLDPARGITNIGSHPGNDIVLDSPGVALFHAMLDHRQKPYQIMLLTQDAQTLVGGKPLAPNVSQALHSWTNIQFDGFTVVVVEADGPSYGAGYAPAPGYQPMPGVPLGPPTSRPETPSDPSSYVGAPYSPEQYPAYPGGGPPPSEAMPPQFPIAMAGPIADELDEVIITEMEERDYTVDVTQTAIYRLDIINGGDIVAMFVVDVIGVDPDWVTIIPPNVNLYEGDRTSVTISITPPRLPSSRAGVSHLAFKVTSPNHPGRVSQLAAQLTINPYYEFSVGELSPKQQTISWFKRAGEVTVSIFNQGNSQAVFQLEAEDAERAASFEFNIPGEPTGRVKQADIRLPADSTVSIPVTVTPRSRRLVGFGKRRYPYTLTTGLPESGQTPRSMLGELNTKPLLGPWIIMLMLLLLLILIVWIFNPRIRLFNSDGSNTRVIRSGEIITLNWNASSLSNLQINPSLGEVNGPMGTATVMPTGDVIYELRAENWLSRINAQLFTKSRQVRIFVTPIPPEIRFFEVDQEEIVQGQEVNLAWHVTNTDDLLLEVNGLPQPLDDFAGTLTDNPDRETSYTLIASNQYRDEQLSRVVRVLPPTPTPVPTPIVRKFVVNPSSIVAGESVTIEWEVEGADDVSIAPLGAGLPPVQSVLQSPEQTTNYVLNASKGSARIEPLARTVLVTPPPTATPEPDAPTITFFVADPSTLVSGDDAQVQLSWSIKGDVTNVEVSGPSLGSPISNLQPADSINVTVEETTLFVLTAFNEDKKASTNAQVQVDEPTPTSTPTVPPTPEPTPTPTAIPPDILSFQIAEDSSRITKLDDDRYRIQVNTDIKFIWSVNAASASAILSEGGAPAGEGTPIGEVTILLTGSGTKTYLLRAENDAGDTTSESIIVEIVDQDAPNAPTNLTGAPEPGKIKLTWDWTFDPDKNDILGFRLYRADTPSTNFTRIADEDDLPKGTEEYEDTLAQTCGKVYYVVAVYQNIEGQILETDASENSWQSPSCP